jgi:hypothetical protein
MYAPRIHWVARGTGTPKDKDDVNYKLRIMDKKISTGRKKSKRKKTGPWFPTFLWETESQEK